MLDNHNGSGYFTNQHPICIIQSLYPSAALLHYPTTAEPPFLFRQALNAGKLELYDNRMIFGYAANLVAGIVFGCISELNAGRIKVLGPGVFVPTMQPSSGCQSHVFGVAWTSMYPFTYH